MINVRTRGEHEGRCEDLDVESPLRCVEVVRSEATPAPGQLAHRKKSLEARGSFLIVPRTENQVYLYQVVKIDNVVLLSPQLTSRRKTSPLST